MQAQAQAVRPASPAPAAVREEGVRWASLTPAQREALAPLEHDWPGIDAPRKQKWIALAGRFKTLTPDERARINARMVEWAKLTPAERGQARMNFEEARQLPAPDRSARWEAYQALPVEQRQQFAARAASAASGARDSAASKSSAKSRDSKEAKFNVVPNPALTQPPKQVAPTMVQAAPGATTTLITRRPTPPPHQQTGMPKIAATPEFVNRSTLLPQARAAGGGRGARQRHRPGGAAANRAGDVGKAGRCRGARRRRRRRADAPRRAAMTAVPGAAAASRRRFAAPSLVRRMACFVYEATLLFGLALIPGALGALFVAQTGQRHPLQSETALRLFALAIYGVYFVWLWSTRGQTLAMQTWRIRLVTAAGAPLTQARALGRYLACCAAWFGPATLLASALRLAALAEPGRGRASGSSAYALSALAAPERQFWHDRLCRTRLVDVRDGARAVRPRPR